MPILNIRELRTKEIIPGFIGRIACTENMMFSHWTIKKGSSLPEHHHVHEQISILIEGEFEFQLDGKKQIITPGMVVMIPSESKHSGLALTDCTIIDIFNPVRKDYTAQFEEM